MGAAEISPELRNPPSRRVWRWPDRANIGTAALFWGLWFLGTVLRVWNHDIALAPAVFIGLAISCALAMIMWIAIAGLIDGLETWSFDRRIIMMTVATVAAALLHGLVHMLLFGGWAGLPIAGYFVARPVPAMMAMWILIYMVWSAMLAARAYARALVERERRIADLQVAQVRAQMEALRYQINPHFLFNTLNSVSALVLDRRVAEADQALGQLADFFRTSLEDHALDTVSLMEEFEAQDRYLKIEQLRFGNRLSAEFDLPPPLEGAHILPFVLQPLVENAVRHGMIAGRAINIRLSAAREGTRLVITVADDGAGVSTKSGHGVGLANVRQRLRLRYGEEALLDTAPRAGGGFAARVTIPFDPR